MKFASFLALLAVATATKHVFKHRLGGSNGEITKMAFAILNQFPLTLAGNGENNSSIFI
jgi:hypothetical protein